MRKKITQLNFETVYIYHKMREQRKMYIGYKTSII